MSTHTSVSCSWCYEMNDITASIADGSAIYCRSCGHRADVLREKCDCRKCGEAERLKRILDKQRETRETEYRTQQKS